MISVKHPAAVVVVLLLIANMAMKVSTAAVVDTKIYRTAIDGWPKPTDSYSASNCGPPCNFTFSPWPPGLNSDFYLGVDCFAAYSLYDGSALITIDGYGFPLEYTVCGSPYFQNIKCPLEKGEKFQISYHDKSFSFPIDGKVKGKLQIQNTEEQDLGCLDFEFALKI